MSSQSFSTGDLYFSIGDDPSYGVTTTTTDNTTSTIYYPSVSGGTTWTPQSSPYMGIPIAIDPALKVNGDIEADGNIKLGGFKTNKMDWDLSRFTLINRLKFLYNLLFKGKAIMEVEPKLIKLEKALEVLRAAK